LSRLPVDPPAQSPKSLRGLSDCGTGSLSAWKASGRRLALVLGLLISGVSLVHAQSGPPASSGGAGLQMPAPGQALALNFKDADIDSVVGAFGHLLNRTFIVDPRVRGKITLETPRPVSPARAYELLKSSLRLQGFAIVESGAIARVLPEADAKLQAGPD